MALAQNTRTPQLPHLCQEKFMRRESMSAARLARSFDNEDPVVLTVDDPHLHPKTVIRAA